MHKTTGYIWDSDTFYSSPKFAVLYAIETSNSDAKHAVVHAQNDRSCLGPIETC